MKVRSCERCGRRFARKDPRTRFCSNSCSKYKSWPPHPSKPCEMCGVVMMKDERSANWAAWEKRRFCSKRCLGLFYRRPEIACSNCGAPFHPVITRRTVFCSKVCYAAYRIGKTKTPEWRLRPARKRASNNFTPSQKKSLLRRSGHACQRCGATKKLEADHVLPVWNGGTNDLGNGQILCRPCHREKTKADVSAYWSRCAA